MLVFVSSARATPGGAKNIFDDDWTPPAATKSSPAATAPAALPRPPTLIPGSTEDSAATGTTVLNPESPRQGASVARASAGRAVPAKADQAISRKLFKEVFATELADRSVTSRRALAQKLVQQADKSSDAPADQFVLLMGATDAAREAADLSLCFQAVDAVATSFNVDPLSLKSDAALNLTAKAATPVDNAENCRAALELIDPLLDREDYATAARLLAAMRAASSADPPIAQQFQVVARRVDALHAAAASIAKERDKLKNAPDDPAANLAVGRFLCFIKADWQHGLPMLAKGSDPSLKALAAKELDPTTDPAEQADLADKWWDLATKEPGPTQKYALRHRAIFWYDQAGARLTGLRKALADQRLAEFRKLDGGDPSLAIPKAIAGAKSFAIPSSDEWVPVDFSVVEGKCYHIVARGQWTDSRGASCEPNGVCPSSALTVLGPQPSLTDQQRRDWYLGQHPRSSLLAAIGGQRPGFFVGADAIFLAPKSDKLSFRINDDHTAPSSQRRGKLDVSISELEPRWLDARGSASIFARIDAMDMLHLTADGPYWEYGGQWGKVGEHDGHYPTVINGIYWWPKWTQDKRSEVLKVPELQLKGHVQLVRVEAKRGNVKMEQGTDNDVILRFTDDGLGSSQVGCTIRFTK